MNQKGKKHFLCYTHKRYFLMQSLLCILLYSAQNFSDSPSLLLVIESIQTKCQFYSCMNSSTISTPTNVERTDDKMKRKLKKRQLLDSSRKLGRRLISMDKESERADKKRKSNQSI